MEPARSSDASLGDGPLDERSDAALFECARRGDARAFERLVRRWEDAAFRIACRIVGDPAAAEDVRQIVFVRLFERADRIGELGCFGAWLRRAVINESISTLRRVKRSPGPLDDDSGMAIVAAESRIDTEDERQRVAVALERLAPEDRALLALKLDEELSFREIAAIVGRPESTLKTRYQRAVATLRRALEDSR